MLLLLWDLQRVKNGRSESGSGSRCDWDSRLPLRCRRCSDEESGLKDGQDNLVREQGRGDRATGKDGRAAGLQQDLQFPKLTAHQSPLVYAQATATVRREKNQVPSTV